MKTPTIDDLELLVGAHETRKDGVCAMEAVAWLAGEPHSDHPQCACPVISALMRSWNDALPDEERNRLLKPLLPLLVGTRSTPAVESQRAYMALDWLIREHMVAWLRLAKLDSHAANVAGWDAARGAAPWADVPGATSGPAARAAAGCPLRPTFAALQASCTHLVRRMAALGRDE